MTDADAMIEEAERNAQSLVAEARANVQRMLAAANEEGEREGSSQAAHMREEIAGLLERMLKEVEGEVVRAAMRVAHELVLAEAHMRPDAVADIAATALQQAKNARDINLRASPRDAAILRREKARLVSVLTRAKDLEIREDRRVKPCGVLIETESGVVDAQLDTQLEELTRILEKPIEGGGGGGSSGGDSNDGVSDDLGADV